MRKIGILLTCCLFISYCSLGFGTDHLMKSDTFNTTPATLSGCELIPPGGAASFDLTDAVGDIVTVQPNITVTWYEDVALTVVIADSTNYISGPATVYAEIVSTLDTSIRATEEVQLIVMDAIITTPDTITVCESIPGSGLAEFDLTSVRPDIFVPQPGLQVFWFADAGLTMPIADSTSYSSGSEIVYAYIADPLMPVCEATVEVTLIVAASPDLSYLGSISDTICGRMELRLGSPKGPDAIYTWTPDMFLDSADISNPVFTPIDNQDAYSYIVTAISLDSMCTSTDTISFLVLDAELEIEGPDTVELCKGEAMTTITATASENPQNIVWTSSRDTLSDLTGPETTIDAEFSTTVIAMLEFENGCVLYDTVFLRVDSLPEFDISWIPDPRQPCNKYCPGDIVTLVTQAPDLACYPDIMHKWTPNEDIVGFDTTLNIAIATGNGPGKLYTRTTTNHACEEVDSHFVDVVDTIIDINGLPMERICRGAQFELTIDDSDWPDLTEVMWSTPSDEVVMLSDDEGQTITVTIADDAPAGAVEVNVTGLKEMCCDASGGVTINVQVPEIPIEPLTVCVGGDGQIFADPTYTGYEWQLLSGAEGLSPTDVFNPMITNVEAGGAILFVTAVAPDGCPSESQFMVTDTMAAPPAIDAVDALCEGGSETVLADPNFTDYNWTATGGTVDPDNTFDPTITVTDPNGATFTVMATDPNGCSTSTSFNVARFLINPPNVQVPTVCAETGEGVINADPTFVNYQWEALNGASVNPDNGPTVTVSDVPVTGANVTFDAERADGCITSGSIFVSTFPEDTLTLINLDSAMAVTQGMTINFMAETSPPADPSQFVWTQNGNVIQTGGATAAVLVTEGVNTICVEYTNSNGCLQTACEDVTGIELEVIIPNAFTPSDDMFPENQRFQPLDATRTPLGVSFITDFKVFNRWGQKVYDNDSNARGWDGRQDGELAPSDVYIYIIEITTEDGESETYTGDVSLIR